MFVKGAGRRHTVTTIAPQEMYLKKCKIVMVCACLTGVTDTHTITILHFLSQHFLGASGNKWETDWESPLHDT